jgi:hypothetical protein
MIKTQFSRRYLEFRELLQNGQLQMFQQTLRILAHRGIEERVLLEIQVPEVSPTFSIYVFRQGQVLSLLGGHWLRKAEPSQDFLREMRGLVSDLLSGMELK